MKLQPFLSSFGCYTHLLSSHHATRLRTAPGDRQTLRPVVAVFLPSRAPPNESMKPGWSKAQELYPDRQTPVVEEGTM